MYRFILAEEAVFPFAQFEPGQQRTLLRAFEQLARHPFDRGLASFRDDSGCENFFFRVDEFLVTFRLDHAAREVRVVGVERI